MVSLIATTPGGMGKYLHIIVEEIVQSVERIMGYCCQVGVSRSVNTLGKCRELSGGDECAQLFQKG